MSILKATKFVQYILESRGSLDCVAVDATMGNGNDTLFLSELVGPKGKVYSFDIQKTALENTRKLLMENNVEEGDSIHLVLDSHDNIDSYIKGEIDVGMFNLGYLPGGDHEIITKADTTIKALDWMFHHLKKGGLVSVIIYYGHEGGNEEKNSVISYIENLDSRKFMVLRSDYINQSKDPPILLLIEKK